MSEEWVKLRHLLFTHPKITRMASALEADNLRTVGGAVSVWCYFDIHSESGVLKNFRPDMLDLHLGWPGFSAAMIAVEWLTDDGDNLSIPRFHQQNGRSAKRRALDNQRKSRVRKESSSKADNMRTRKEKKEKEQNKEQEQDGDTTASPPSPSTKQRCAVEKPKIPSCPYDALLALYHGSLPELTQHRMITTKLRAQLSVRWRRMPNLDRWRDFFDYVRQSPFLMGQSPPSPGHPQPFAADLRWLTREENFAKTTDGTYHGSCAND